MIWELASFWLVGLNFIVVAHLTYSFNSKLKSLKIAQELRIKECETQIGAMANLFGRYRQGTMAAAIKDATENPEKYLEGSYFIKPEEGKKDERPME